MPKKSGKTTIHDIAYELGLNASTVSRALANNPVVSKKTRELVHAKAKELNYQPNRIAAALRRGRSDIMGVVVPAIDRAFFSSVIRGIEEKADAQGYHIIVCQSYDSSERERSMVETLKLLQVDGILISTAKDGDEESLAFYQNLLDNGYPIQFFDHVPAGLKVPAVVIDDEAGGYEATKHLIDQGYRRIAHLRGPQKLHIYKGRYEGYLRALQDAGIALDERLVVDIVSHFDSGAKAMHQLWELPERPDAIFSASDFSAAEGMRAAIRLGLSVPEDLAFIGFSNEPFTNIVTPQLSTVDQQTMQMGHLAAERLMKAIDNKADELCDEMRVVLSPRVITRGSSRAGVE